MAAHTYLTVDKMESLVPEPLKWLWSQLNNDGWLEDVVGLWNESNWNSDLPLDDFLLACESNFYPEGYYYREYLI